jgi:cell volume regulation protein A
MDVSELDRILLAGAAVLLVAIVAVRFTGRLGLPSLLIYLGIGLALGESGPGNIQFEDAQLAHALGFAALVIILTEGGLTTRWNEVRPMLPLGVVRRTDRSDHLADGLGGRVLGAAPGPCPAAVARRARG